MEDRISQDWGGYQPETQKALRFVASLAGKGTAKQVAGAIAQEYTKREAAKPVQAKKQVRKKPTESEYATAIESIEDPFSRRIARYLHEKVPGWTL